jgi:hypothetical protein
MEQDRKQYFISEGGIVVLCRGEPRTNWVTAGGQ